MLSPCAALILSASVLAGAESNSSPTPIPDEHGLPGVFETHSSESVKPGAMLLGIGGRINRDISIVENGLIIAPGTDRLISDAAVSTLRPFLAAGLGLGFDLAVAMPFYYEYLPGAKSSPEEWGTGDVSAILKARIPVRVPHTTLSLFLTGSAPTSSRDGILLPKQLAYQPASNRMPDDVSHASGMENPRAGLGAGASLDLSDAMDGPRVGLHVNLSGDRTLASDSKNPLGTFAASIALEAYLTESVRLESEFRHQRLIEGVESFGSPVGKSTTIGAGLGWLTSMGFSIRGGAIVAPTAWNHYIPLAIGTNPATSEELSYRLQPTMSGYLQMAWQGFPLGRDGDRDGTPDGKDRCPAIAEDRDGFQDDDGCPDPDNDGDGVNDDSDNCPYTSEDHDGFEDRDGCSEMDNDRDGYLDTADRCPNDPEDRDGFLDEDGCPDLDDDRDGIPDAVDKCPQKSENRNGVEDDDGCPELDTDGDLIPDSRDKCPREDEIVNFFQDEDGCPDEKPEPIRDAILTGVVFQSGGSELLPASFLVLDGLASRMFAYPGTEIEIQGHLDDRAGAGAKTLSKARAEAVVEYLVNRGIESRRMKSVGYGASKPMGSNRTAQGRADNRRIQIRRLN
jgi:outer membrane protein OmpA-like peptidoglycan-associated protein